MILSSRKFKFIEHTADVKFQAFGKSIEKVFSNSALALKETICGKRKIKRTEEKKIIIEGKDFESLLYEFLEEIIYLLDAENFIIKKVKEIKIEGFKLTAVLEGDRASHYNFTNSAKAITYNEMFVKEQKKRWIVQVVVDV